MQALSVAGFKRCVEEGDKVKIYSLKICYKYLNLRTRILINYSHFLLQTIAHYQTNSPTHIHTLNFHSASFTKKGSTKKLGDTSSRASGIHSPPPPLPSSQKKSRTLLSPRSSAAAAVHTRRGVFLERKRKEARARASGA